MKPYRTIFLCLLSWLILVTGGQAQTTSGDPLQILEEDDGAIIARFTVSRGQSVYIGARSNQWDGYRTLVARKLPKEDGLEAALLDLDFVIDPLAGGRGIWADAVFTSPTLDRQLRDEKPLEWRAPLPQKGDGTFSVFTDTGHWAPGRMMLLGSWLLNHPREKDGWVAVDWWIGENPLNWPEVLRNDQGKPIREISFAPLASIATPPELPRLDQGPDADPQRDRQVVRRTSEFNVSSVVQDAASTLKEQLAVSYKSLEPPLPPEEREKLAQETIKQVHQLFGQYAHRLSGKVGTTTVAATALWSFPKGSPGEGVWLKNNQTAVSGGELDRYPFTARAQARIASRYIDITLRTETSVSYKPWRDSMPSLGSITDDGWLRLDTTLHPECSIKVELNLSEGNYAFIEPAGVRNKFAEEGRVSTPSVTYRYNKPFSRVDTIFLEPPPDRRSVPAASPAGEKVAPDPSAQ